MLRTYPRSFSQLIIRLLSLCPSNVCMCVLLRNLYLYISFSISCCLVVMAGRVLVIVGESVVGVM
jgi:hypothetical protein